MTPAHVLLAVLGLVVPLVVLAVTHIARLSAVLAKLATSYDELARGVREDRATSADTRERVIALEHRLPPYPRRSPSRP